MVKVASVNLTLNLLCSSIGSSVSEVSVCEVVYLNRLVYVDTVAINTLMRQRLKGKVECIYKPVSEQWRWEATFSTNL